MAKKQDIKQQRIEELENQLKRAVADYQNLEKRVNEGRHELTSFVGMELVRKLLPVLDHLEQALAGVKATAMSEQSESNGWFKGVELAVKEFNGVLAQEGLDQVATDGAFDPSLHEAVDTRDGENDMILEVVRKGYNLNGKVLRPAQVIVGRAASTEVSADKEGNTN
ncbi:nucleotide exchange factor GrpE [Candidatus Daviesbacteria bacterium RIFCSPHIGHO2_02_FULL_36_13]|uniref:Protein GrpE n=1 Tax=Candidatus Daviesbacteria bacterium RIFCSPHIGHO2_02_FULL_36_13 TaxID=1797768 RepID=A0A1F5JWI1_9BACT|nr:MAG: nucleotide exchange factor GrpE [Candidatus Daviesbacteria bacterium RIFCSPHIGHO2_02_FULL_36_13]OGE42455.1 MAG: nucleotide exchange factor GrpE [Candidatus Daviesbacteria bacterium RIFCSPLOWO2_01_FULL_36_8]